MVYNDFMSRLIRDLFSMFILFNLLNKSPEFFMCELLIVPKRRDNILAKDFPILDVCAIPVRDITIELIKNVCGFVERFIPINFC